MVLILFSLLMDEIESGFISHHQLQLSKFHNESSQLNTIFKNTQISLENPSADQQQLHHHNHHLQRSSNSSSTPTTTSSLTNAARKSLSSSSNPLNEFLKPHSILSQNNSSESDDDDSNRHDEINLYPLSNQVGGHTRLLLLNEKTVIKPLNIRELEFYQNIPGNDIQHFVPKYKGMCVSK